MRLAFDRIGAGPPIVLLHPLGTDRHVWDPVLPALAREREVVAFDLPGFGKSLPLTGVTPTPRALADVVATELRRIGLERPHVAGNSLGGWVALELGLREAAASVAAIAPAGLWTRTLRPKASWGHRLAHRLEPVADALVQTSRGRRLLLAGSMAHPERLSAADASHLLHAYARAPGFVAVNDAMRAHRFTGLDAIACPLTFGWPDRDRLVARPDRLPDAADELMIRDAGHIPTWDAPDQVTSLLLRSSRVREPV